MTFIAETPNPVNCGLFVRTVIRIW